MKNLILALACCVFSATFANDDIEDIEKIYNFETKTDNSYWYVQSGAFSWAIIPFGGAVGYGYRWCGDNYALGASINFSGSLAFLPCADLTLEALYFTDSRRYMGLQLGAAIGKTTINEIKTFANCYPQYDIDLNGDYCVENEPVFEEKTYKLSTSYILPILKFIPYGCEWVENGHKQFWHVALFPVGLSFSYGWEI